MRIGRRGAGGRLQYLDRDERALTTVLPQSPAAVRVYGPDGCCAALHLDLDASRGGIEAVDRDHARLIGWLDARGARYVTDVSPSGGRHIYVPFAERVPMGVARELVEALATSHPTLDASPHRSLRTGCIRPPGAVHRAGGHQQLTMRLADAYDVLRRPNAPRVLASIVGALREQVAAWRAQQTADATTAPVLEPDEGADRPRRALSARLREIAETASWDTARYASPSEARQAVITGAAAAGWTLADVTVRLADGRWPGLASLYARYPVHQRHGSVARDWHAAQALLNDTSGQSADAPVRKSHTSPSESQGGRPTPGSPQAEHDFLRTWRTVLRATEQHRFPGRAGHLQRMVLRAMGEAAHKTASRYVAFGVRSLAVAAGAEYSTVAAVLRELAQDPDGWIDLLEPARGERADLYELKIPRQLERTAADLRWDKGHAHALRPAFRALGHVAAFVFEALETGRARTITDLVPATGLSRSAVYEAVERLHAWGLVDRSPNTLTARPEMLRTAAEQLGVLDVVTAQIHRYATERRQWRQFLHRHDTSDEDAATEVQPDDTWWWPPDDSGWTLVNALVA